MVPPVYTQHKNPSPHVRISRAWIVRNTGYVRDDEIRTFGLFVILVYSYEIRNFHNAVIKEAEAAHISKGGIILKEQYR